MPKASRKGSFAVGEAGTKFTGAFGSKATMPKASRASRQWSRLDAVWQREQ